MMSNDGDDVDDDDDDDDDDNDGDDHVPCFLFEKLYKQIAELPIHRPTGAEY